MFSRTCSKAFLLAGLFLPLTSCISSPSLTSIVVNPATETWTMPATGCPLAQNNFTATGYYTHPDHPAITKDITTQVTWTSLTPEIVTIGQNTGVATVACLATGTTQISASAPGYNGDIIGYATVNVQLATTSSVVPPKAKTISNGM
ncbi:MAG: hypothetical protein ABSD67_07405 [Terracidiphilus sp.]